MKTNLQAYFKSALLVALCIVIAFASAACGGSTTASSVQSSSDQTDTQSSASSGPNLMWGDTPLGQTSSNKTSSLIPHYSTDKIVASKDKTKSNTPAVTVAAQVENNICIVAGF